MKVYCSEKMSVSDLLKTVRAYPKGLSEAIEQDLYDTLPIHYPQVGIGEEAKEYTFFENAIGFEGKGYETTNMLCRALIPSPCMFIVTGFTLERRHSQNKFVPLCERGGYARFFIGSKVFVTYPTDIGHAHMTPCYIPANQNFGIWLKLQGSTCSEVRARLHGFYIRPVA